MIEQNIFLLRGLARESGHWGEFVETLQQKLPHAHIHTLDYPGVGLFYMSKSPTKISAYVDALRADFLKVSGHSENHIFGLSFGGMQAVDWTTRFPEDFKTVTLLNTSLGRYSKPWFRMFPRTFGRLIREVGREPHPLKREKILVSLVSHNPTVAHQLVSAWTEVAELRPVTPENFARQLLAAACYLGPKEKPKIPTMVLNSEKDRFVSPRCSAQIARRWGVPFFRHSWGGHDLIVDDPHWVAQKLKCFIAGEIR